MVIDLTRLGLFIATVLVSAGIMTVVDGLVSYPKMPILKSLVHDMTYAGLGAAIAYIVLH
jgi:hypothetical protein